MAERDRLDDDHERKRRLSVSTEPLLGRMQAILQQAYSCRRARETKMRELNDRFPAPQPQTVDS